METKRIIAHNHGKKMWETENFGNVWVVWNFNDKSLQSSPFELKWPEINEWIEQWKKENKESILEFLNK